MEHHNNPRRSQAVAGASMRYVMFLRQPIKGEFQRDAFVGFKPPRLTTVPGVHIRT